MAVAFDAKSVDQAFTGGVAGVQTLTHTGLTVVSNVNGAIILIFAIADPSVQTPALGSVTGYTFIGAKTGGTSALFCRIEIWGKIGNTTGAQSIACVTNSAWTTSTTSVACAMSVTGANQTGGVTTFANFVSNGATSTAISSGNVTTGTTHLAMAATTVQNTISAGNHTSIYLDNGPNPSSAAQYAQGPTSPVTFTWTTGSDTWSIVAVDITPVAAGDTLGEAMQMMMM